MKKALVTGAGGFIGHHLVKRLVTEGYWVRGVDIKRPEFEKSSAQQFELLDLRNKQRCIEALLGGFDEVYHLAANMGGIGFISENHSDICHDNTLMDLHMLEASRIAKADRFFFSSSACVYPIHIQQDASVVPLREDSAWPANPEPGYGLEKLYMEKLCEYYSVEGRVTVRVARFHNVFGPCGTYDGGREKAPAALCRKVAQAKDGDVIEVWGDGSQTRSFLYIKDCVEGICQVMRSSVFPYPLNIGSDRLVSIRWLVEKIVDISGKDLKLKFYPNFPQGVRGRNSDNTKVQALLGWQPVVPLEIGLEETYRWIEKQILLTSTLS